MKNKIIAKLKMVKDSSITSRSLTTDDDVLGTVDSLVTLFNQVVEEKQGLQIQVDQAKGLEDFQKARVDELKADCHRLQKVLHLGSEVPAIQKDLIDQATYDQLKQYQTDFQAQADDKFPMKCEKCGSTMARRSSVEVSPPAATPERKKTGPQEVDFM